MRKHSFEKRLGLVKKVKSGYPIKRLAQEQGIAYISIKDWVRVYDLYGTEGLRNMSMPNFVSNSEKERMCRLYLEKGVPLPQIYVPNKVSRDALRSWIDKVKEGGYSALYGENQKYNDSADMVRSENEVLKEELRKAQRENLLLRAENALLKKAKALMEEEESRLKASGHKPSKR
jgi:transposase